MNAHIDGFSETGGFGALSVNAADGNSFPTTLGAAPHLAHKRSVITPSSCPSFASAGATNSSTPRKRSRPRSSPFPGSTFSATGINFGRDAALIGAGLSLELSPDAKVFVDYDGRLSQRLQEHSVSGGLRVRF